ncbi:MAG TPA: acylneuraminate cytidylyltransferase, partial [Acetivibrio sp.]|nr:acylneuraminate cytidylyltransferase [Acetivibrio sp.]
MKTGVIVQTRMGSTRLPGKVMMDLCGKPVIDHVIDRLKRSRLSDE